MGASKRAFEDEMEELGGFMREARLELRKLAEEDGARQERARILTIAWRAYHEASLDPATKLRELARLGAVLDAIQGTTHVASGASALYASKGRPANDEDR